MDANAIAAALQGLLGPDVRKKKGGMWWEWPSGDKLYTVFRDGDLGVEGDSSGPVIPTADLDKLHAASQIVRRMAGEAS